MRDGALHHQEFLADGGNDPRRRFAETLIDALETSDGPIIVYSAYEQTRLRELAAEFPDLSAPLNAADRPLGGPAAHRAQRRLPSRISIQQLDQVRRPGPLLRIRL